MTKITFGKGTGRSRSRTRISSVSESQTEIDLGEIHDDAVREVEIVDRSTAQDSVPVRSTVLFLAANPVDTPPLRLGEESRAIDEALLRSSLRDRLRLEQSHALRVRDVTELLLRFRPSVLHFSGHGSPAGELVFEDDLGRRRELPGDVLSGLFAALRDGPRCVVLNACWSDRQAAAIAKHVDVVLGMKRPVTDSAAILFASAFYRGIGHGRSVGESFELALAELSLRGPSPHRQQRGSFDDRVRDLHVEAGTPDGSMFPSEATTPKLSARSGVDAWSVVIAK